MRLGTSAARRGPTLGRMADAIVRATAIRWVSDDQPRVIEVGIVDSDGQEHRIREKVPVPTHREITSASALPANLWIKADAGTVECEHVEVTLAHSVEATEGLTELKVAIKDVIWL